MAEKELVLVTGGSGYIDSAVVKRLSDSSRVIVLDRPDPEGAEERLNFVPIDLGSDESVQQALATVREHYGRIASVIHLAAYYDISGEPNPL